MRKIAYLYVSDTMADWEPGYIISELHSGRYFREKTLKYEVKTVSLTMDPITTMGGVKILPDIMIHDLMISEAGILILPGGDTWLEPLHDSVFLKVKEFLDNHIPVAAICGATLGLAANGFLDYCKHTSNDLEYVKAICPTYRGEAFYQQQPVVVDGDLITASGVAALDFAYAVLKKLDVFLPATLEAWYNLYQTHDPTYFFALMNSLPRIERGS
ncbi:putative intracellular protease, ThiJ/PfpI family [Candidatus Vecturithrix granuli]|uniref:Putative intracellular protease, ThiJ/PfpI family n=1 Tax=Vecturithrix granuli TaxID=1499967 RepID=A0A0S6W943_VECG1|nr:putative intracellular protease, ThiJ/PfpI family [Candidatus Vecturithrix granuli]